MKFFACTALVLVSLTTAACAGLAPTTAEMAQVPKVRFGDPAPAGQEFVAFFPAGTPLPVIAAIDGSLLDRSARSELHVTLKRDVYVFRRWLSFDGKTWLRSDDVVDSRFEIKLPGVVDGRNPGALSASFNLK